MAELSRSKSFNAFDTIMELMNQENFRKLVNTNFEHYSDIQSIVLIVKTYQYLESMYYKHNNEIPSKDYMANGIRELLRNSKTRKFLLNSSQLFMKDTNTFEAIVEENIGNKLLMTSMAQEKNFDQNLDQNLD